VVPGGTRALLSMHRWHCVHPIHPCSSFGCRHTLLRDRWSLLRSLDQSITGTLLCAYRLILQKSFHSSPSLGGVTPPNRQMSMLPEAELNASCSSHMPWCVGSCSFRAFVSALCWVLFGALLVNEFHANKFWKPALWYPNVDVSGCEV
jgi:hypothetical protein